MARKPRPLLGIRSETPRAGDRQLVALVGECSVGGDDAIDVTVLDLDRFGCRVRGLAIGISKQDDLALTIGPVGPIAAQLRWARNMMAGIAFAEPLSEEELRIALTEGQSVDEGPRVLAFRRRA